MTFYTDRRNTADRLIAKYGQAITLRRTTMSGPDYDPTGSPTDYATKAAKIEFTLKQLQGGTILETDERWFVSAGPLAALGITDMRPTDRLVMGDGTDRQIVNAVPLSPAGTVVVFDVQARK